MGSLGTRIPGTLILLALRPEVYTEWPPMVKVKDLDLPPEQQASHLHRIMSFIQIIYDRQCSILTISTILFPDVDLCRSVVCGSESLSQLSSLGVFRVGSLDCGLPRAETGPAKGMYSTFLRDMEIIFGVLSSNCYAKSTFNPPPHFTPKPIAPLQKTQISFLSVITFCLLWWLLWSTDG